MPGLKTSRPISAPMFECNGSLQHTAIQLMAHFVELSMRIKTLNREIQCLHSLSHPFAPSWRDCFTAMS